MVNTLVHFRQKTNVTCGATAYRTILSHFNHLISEKQAVDEVKTTKNGTSSRNVLSAFKNREINASFVFLGIDFEEYSKWLNYNSKGRLLYLSCHFFRKPTGIKRGRNRVDCHAIVVSEGLIYDPAKDSPIPIECFMDTEDKRIYIHSMIMIDK